MKYHRITIGLLICISVSLNSIVAAPSGSLFDQRMSRRSTVGNARSESSGAEQLNSSSGFTKSAEANFVDTKINTDNGNATFTQRHCDVAHFSDGRGVVVWEDERNGVFTIAAQPVNSSGQATGANFFLNAANLSESLLQPTVVANSTNTVLVAYVKESNNGLYARMYDLSMTAVGTEYRIDDAASLNFVNQPQAARLANDRLVIVWEDSRNGSNIYGQILNADGSKNGANFLVNQNLTSPYRIAPSVASNLAGNFAVVWEDGRSDNGDVYFRLMSDAGAALYPELRLDNTNATDYQFMPKIEFLKGNKYFTAWISNRSGGQSIYAQLISGTSVPSGSTFRVNDEDGDVCWDLEIANSNDSGVVCAWAEYSTSAAIETQKISTAGLLVGANQPIEDGGLAHERAFPSLAKNATGMTVVWCDERDNDFDIYAQRLDLAIAKINSNYRVNDDTHGAQQSNPDIAPLNANSVALVWNDQRDGDGDILFQVVSSAGSLSGAAVKLNDDAGPANQTSPQVSSSANGTSWTVWEDSRVDGGLTGQNILAQRLGISGNRLGANFLVNSDGTARPKSQPDVDVAADGKACITWIDERDNSTQVYVQSYASNGAVVGGNVKVSNLPPGTQNRDPRVALLSDGSFVVAWIGNIGENEAGFFQRYNSSGTSAGSVSLVGIDTAAVDIIDIDISAHETLPRYYIATVESESNNTNVKMYSYESDGSPIISPAIVSDIPGSYNHVRMTTDVDDAIAIVWEALAGGNRRNRVQLMREDGFALGSNQLISSSEATRVETSPAVTAIGGYYYSTWADSRNSGAGFDIFVNSIQYTATDVDDDSHNGLPAEFSLNQNFPNPFNPSTTISYSLDKPARVNLCVFNIVGQKVGELVNEFQVAGSHEANWDAVNASVPSGVYFYRLTVGGKAVTRKMALVK